MKRYALPVILLALTCSGIWYWWLGRDAQLDIVSFNSDDAAIAVIVPGASRGDILSAIAYFENDLEATKSNPRIYSYYAASLSMFPLYQPNPVDKQASSAKAEAVFSDIAEAYPEQALSILFESISLMRSPEFLQLDEKSYLRLTTALDKIIVDSADSHIRPINAEALGILVKFLPVFQKTYSDRNRADLSLDQIIETTGALSSTWLRQNM